MKFKFCLLICCSPKFVSCYPVQNVTLASFLRILLLEGKVVTVLQLTILNKSGRIWTMVAGGGASVIYSDTICDLGGASDLANYGEYSGAPSEQQTYEYAKTILGLMCQEKHPKGKVSIIRTNLNVWVHCCS